MSRAGERYSGRVEDLDIACQGCDHGIKHIAWYGQVLHRPCPRCHGTGRLKGYEALPFLSEKKVEGLPHGADLR